MFKYKVYILIFSFILLITINFVRASENNFSLLGKVIYIDPGHGGLDPGAIYKNIKEKDINLKISKILEKKLSKLGAIVYMTRYGDYDLSVNNTINKKRSDLSRRGNIINKSECDLFLSIHLNSVESGLWKGAQTFYSDKNKKNKVLAEILQKEFQLNLNSTREYKKTNDLYLQKRINQVGTLIEVGFLSNANERYLLQQSNYQNKVANTIVNGIIKYFKKQ